MFALWRILHIQRLRLSQTFTHFLGDSWEGCRISSCLLVGVPNVFRHTHLSSWTTRLQIFTHPSPKKPTNCWLQHLLPAFFTFSKSENSQQQIADIFRPRWPPKPFSTCRRLSPGYLMMIIPTFFCGTSWCFIFDKKRPPSFSCGKNMRKFCCLCGWW